MNSFSDMIWVEWRKAVRSRMPLFTTLGSLAMPAGIAFLVFVSRNPDVSRKLGLVSAKANLLTDAATTWPAYLALSAQMIAAGGFIIFCLITSWVFGREFADGTLKDMLAVPVRRSSILLAKFVVVGLWSAVLSLILVAGGLGMGALMQLPLASLGVFVHGAVALAVSAALAILVVTPMAFFASAGRGYLLPIGIAGLLLMMANVSVIIGWGEYFPWAVPALYAQGKSQFGMPSYLIVVLTGLVGVVATYLWWKYSDQSR